MRHDWSADENIVCGLSCVLRRDIPDGKTAAWKTTAWKKNCMEKELYIGKNYMSYHVYNILQILRFAA